MNIEDRVTSLEGMVSTLSRVATQQLARNRETDERLTMLLGIAAGQESDIKSMLGRLDSIEQRLDGIEQHLVRLESHIDERFDAIIALVSGHQPKPPTQ